VNPFAWTAFSTAYRFRCSATVYQVKSSVLEEVQLLKSEQAGRFSNQQKASGSLLALGAVAAFALAVVVSEQHHAHVAAPASSVVVATQGIRPLILMSGFEVSPSIIMSGSKGEQAA
jgi:hypothetical protein